MEEIRGALLGGFSRWSQLECVAETMRHTLNVLAVVAPNPTVSRWKRFDCRPMLGLISLRAGLCRLLVHAAQVRHGDSDLCLSLAARLCGVPVSPLPLMTAHP